jgi:hypothetical protein
MKTAFLKNPAKKRTHFQPEPVSGLDPAIEGPRHFLSTFIRVYLRLNGNWSGPAGPPYPICVNLCSSVVKKIFPAVADRRSIRGVRNFFASPLSGIAHGGQRSILDA